MIYCKPLIYILISIILGCSNDQAKLIQEKSIKERNTLILLSTFRSKGECLRKETSLNSSIYTCSKYDFGLCSVNLLIFTSGEKSKLLSDSNTLIQKRPECNESLVLSGLLSQTITTNDEIDTFKKNNIFSGLESCNTKNFNNYEKLVTKEELLFLKSYRGKIGTSAYKSSQAPFETSIKKNASDCLANEFLESEKLLLKDIYSGTKVIEVKCTEDLSTGLCN